MRFIFPHVQDQSTASLKNFSGLKSFLTGLSQEVKCVQNMNIQQFHVFIHE